MEQGTCIGLGRSHVLRQIDATRRETIESDVRKLICVM